ncbi:MAG: glycosyltransferase family 4 protein [Desulfobacterales bacterium]|nr:glycosyltransferase family 4 protein [Desulfobacterales bacterium]MCF8078456.1 glycosyltransferase family 4 protein [Desulfobacterales bacterium]
MPPRKILYLVEDLNIGGLERIIETLYEGLDREKFSPSIWCLADGGVLAKKLLQRKESIRVLDFKSYHDPSSFLRLARLIAKGHFDVVHTHGYYAGILGRGAALLARTPVVISHVHTIHWDLNRRNRWMEKVLSLITDRVICCSEAARGFMQEKVGVRPDKLTRIYNGVACRKIPAPTKSERKFVRICVVASLVENKGHRILMEAAAMVQKRHPSLVLTLVGDGPLKEALRLYANQLDIDSHTEFLGMQQDVQAVLARSDIAVLPSLYREGLGLSLLEAMCQGLPLIGSDTGGIPEVIRHGINGYLVAPGSVLQMKLAIEALIADPHRRSQMGENGRRLAEEKFSALQMVREIETLYERFLHG